MSRGRAKRRKQVNEPVKLWFHGQDETDRVLMGIIAPLPEPKPTAQVIQLRSEATLVARYEQQLCARCQHVTAHFAGLFNRTPTVHGYAYGPAVLDPSRTPVTELVAALPVHACLSCAQANG